MTPGHRQTRSGCRQIDVRSSIFSKGSCRDGRCQLKGTVAISQQYAGRGPKVIIVIKSACRRR